MGAHSETKKKKRGVISNISHHFPRSLDVFSRGKKRKKNKDRQNGRETHGKSENYRSSFGLEPAILPITVAGAYLGITSSSWSMANSSVASRPAKLRIA